MAAISNSSAEDAAEDVVSAVVAWHDAIGDGEGQCAQVIGDDAESDRCFHFFCEDGTIGAEFGVDIHVGFSAEFFEFAEDRLENVGGVVRGFFREIREAFGVLDDGTCALKTHAGIDVFGREFAEGAIGFCVVLDENEVPDFDAEIGVVVDEVTTCHRISLGC